MNNITQLGQEFGQYMTQLTSELFLRTSQPHSLSEMERNIRVMLLKVGQFLLSSWFHYPTIGCNPIRSQK